MQCTGNSGYFLLGKRAAIVRRNPTFSSPVFSCFHTTDCVAYSLKKMDMESLTCAQMWVRAVHTKGVRHKQVCTRDDRRLSGVGFMIKHSIASKLRSLPVGHSDRRMSLRLPLQVNQCVTIISVYSPMQTDLNSKETYRELRSLLLNIDSAQKVLVIGDFSAQVGKDFDVWPGVLGRHGVGKCNDNGRMLLELRAEHALPITNTLFQQKTRFKTTWKHPRSKHWHHLDYILVRQKDTREVLHTRA